MSLSSSIDITSELFGIGPGHTIPFSSAVVLEIDNYKFGNSVKSHSYLEVIKTHLETVSKQIKMGKYFALPEQ